MNSVIGMTSAYIAQAQGEGVEQERPMPTIAVRSGQRDAGPAFRAARAGRAAEAATRKAALDGALTGSAQNAAPVRSQ